MMISWSAASPESDLVVALPSAARRIKGIAIAARDVVGTGGGTVALETARYMAAAGYDVRLVVDTDLAAAITGVQVQVTPFGRWLKSWNPRGKIAFRIRHLLQILAFSVFGRIALSRYEKSGFVSLDHNLEAWGADIVVLHNVFVEQYRADKRSLLRRLPQFCNPVFGLRLVRERLTLRSSRVRGVIAVSESTLAEARPYIPKAKPIRVIESGINLEKFAPLPEAERRASRIRKDVDGKFVLLFVGHEFERKRLDLVISALAQLPKSVVLWVIGGRMSTVDNYVGLSRKLDVAERVQFLGTLPNPSDFFEAADAFVLPSDYETWGLVTLEAMACGVPAIMTSVGCAPHVIKDGETGFIVPSDAKAIAEKVRLLVDSNDLHRQTRLAARKMAENYGWTKVAEQYVALALQIGAGRVNGS